MAPLAPGIWTEVEWDLGWQAVCGGRMKSKRFQLIYAPRLARALKRADGS